jgi:prepilin-type N-terminal cleavage/methylation domain-containing protein
MSGFTLIELMVVIVIIGVLASLAIPRFTEASNKAKVAEAPRVLASFESAYLAAVAEVGEGQITADDLDLFKIPSSNWFQYELLGTGSAVNAASATASIKMGDILEKDFFSTTYSGGEFAHAFSKCGPAPKPSWVNDKGVTIPPGPTPEDLEDFNTNQAAPYARSCNQIRKYVPNFGVRAKEINMGK